MNCPYCRKRTKDMPTHLDKNKMCAERHHVNLRGQFIDVVRVTLAQQAIAGANDSPQIKVCPECGGNGRSNWNKCPTCNGTGKL